MNKKAKTQALFMSLSDKVRDGKLFVVDQIALNKPKTAEFVKVMQVLKAAVKDTGKKQLLLLPKKEDNLQRASRNIQNLETLRADSINTYQVMKADSMIILKDALAVIEKVYLKNEKRKVQSKK